MDNIESRREFLRKAPLRLAGACAVMSEVPEACARVVSDRVFEFLHDEGAVPFLEKIAVPSGLRRVWVPKGSFGEWMRQLPVKQRNNGIFDKDGKRVFGSEMAHSIVDMDVWRYQECADVAMRLWGEYLYATDQLHRLDMRLENGSRNPKSRPYDRRSFKKYFLYQFGYASSWVLKRDLEKVSIPDAMPGDVIVLRQPGTSQGHVFVIMDVAKDADGKPKVVIGQSNIPAQSFHIVPNNPMPYKGWEGYRDEFTKGNSIDFSDPASLTLDKIRRLFGELPAIQDEKNSENNHSCWFDLELFMMQTRQDPNGQGVIRRFY